MKKDECPVCGKKSWPGMICSPCHKSAVNMLRRFMASLKAYAISFKSTDELIRIGRHFIGKLSETNAKRAQEIGCISDAKKVLARSVSLDEYISKYCKNSSDLWVLYQTILNAFWLSTGKEVRIGYLSGIDKDIVRPEKLNDPVLFSTADKKLFQYYESRSKREPQAINIVRAARSVNAPIYNERLAKAGSAAEINALFAVARANEEYHTRKSFQYAYNRLGHFDEADALGVWLPDEDKVSAVESKAPTVEDLKNHFKGEAVLSK